MLRHEAGHLVIDPVFASISHRDEKPDCFIAIDIDDCDCEFCVQERMCLIVTMPKMLGGQMSGCNL